VSVVGTLHVQCPECDVVVPIEVRAELATSETEDARQTISLDPDLTDLWAQAWAHTDP
jgi:hypothetical protein